MNAKWIAIFLAALSPLAAQQAEHRPHAKPNLAAPAPKVGGRPDLTGLWLAERTPVSEFTRVLGDEFATQQVDLDDVATQGMNVFWGLKPEEEPLRPEGAEILNRRRSVPGPGSHCLPTGVPASTFIYALKLVQSPGALIALPGDGSPAREIHTDGRALPADPAPSWMGYSVGKWEGDRLIVDTTGFKEESWLDLFGHPRSEKMHVREIWHRRDFGHMELEVRIEDPKFYTRPIGFKTVLNLIPDGDFVEFVCDENERDRVHIEKH